MLTIQETKEQYNSMRKTREYLSGRVGEIKTVLNDNPQSPVVFLGSGSSYSIGESCAQNTITGLKRPAFSITAGDALINSQRYGALFENAIIVVVTRSGETSEIIRALDVIKKTFRVQGVISITCKENSPLVGLSDIILEMPWAFDNSVCQTRTVSCFYFSWLYLVSKITDNKAQLLDLEKVIEGGGSYLNKWEEKLKEIAALPWNHAVVLGDAEISGICEEGALAFKEICQLPSNFYHLLDVRHGPMVLVNKNTLVIMPLSDYSPELQKVLVEDIKKKGATVIVYTNKETNIDGVCNVYFGQELSYPVIGLPLIALIQLVTYHKSVLTGTDPDNPTGLSAWINLN